MDVMLAPAEILPFTAHRLELRPGVWTAPEWADDPLKAPSTQILVDRAGGSLAGKRILDVGCLEGGYTAAFAKLGAGEAVGLEIRETNLQRCRFLQEQLGLRNARFIKGDAKTISRDALGAFDAVFASGLLYHLDDPIDFLRRAAELTDDLLLLDTHVAVPYAWAHACGEELTARTFGDEAYVGRVAYDLPPNLSPEEVDKLHWASFGNLTSFWLTEDSLVRALWSVGFPYVSKAYMRRPYKDGEKCTWECRIILVAKKDWVTEGRRSAVSEDGAKQLDALRSARAQLEERCATLERERDVLRRELQETAGARQRTQQQLSEAIEEGQRLERCLTDTQVERDYMRTSFSWRTTAPLRSIRALLRHGHRA